MALFIDNVHRVDNTVSSTLAVYLTCQKVQESTAQDGLGIWLKCNVEDVYFLVFCF